MTTSQTNTPTTNETTPARRFVPLMEKRDRMLTAWNSLAPQAKFAELTVAQFQAQTAPSEEARQALLVSKSQVALLARDTRAKAQALNELLKRAALAVRLDATQGDNSPLYRSMGFVPASDRKSGGSRLAGAEELPAPARQPTLRERYQRILMAWEKAEGVSLPGITLEELRAAGTAYEASRLERLGEDARRSLLVQNRRLSDQSARETIRQVIGGVIASREHGINSALYRAMGYIPNDERKGRSRSASAAANTTPVTV